MTQRLEVPSLVDALYAAVRTRILTGELSGGEPVTEAGLAATYDVARPTGKAVIERLAHDGLLVRGPHKTARVRVVGADHIRDLYYSRGLFEREAVTSLAAKKEVPLLAYGAVEEMQRASDEQSVSGVVAADVAYHRALIEALGSQRLTRMYLSLIGEVQLCMAQVQTNRLLQAGVIIKEHRGILTAIERGNPQLASDRMAAHLARASNQLAGHLERHAADDAPRGS